MNAKEAMEILARNDKLHPKTEAKAEGFLEAVEKFRPIIEMIEAWDKKRVHTREYPSRCGIHQAIESYRRDVLGEE